VAPALDHAAKLGYRRIVVFPYFLFTGVLVNRIYDAAYAAQARYPGIEILKAPYLDDHPLVLDTLLDRIREMLVGQNLMNCALCKYREQVLGFEAEVGLRQESHHHHVEGIGGGLENCPCAGDCDGSCRDEAFCRRHGLPWTPLHTHEHGHDHRHPHTHATGHHVLAIGRPALTSFGATPAQDHDHTHDHHHHPYPHARHPLGPVTLPPVQGRRAREEQE
jgi:sirohydrochlorin cobaltochelatase